MASPFLSRLVVMNSRMHVAQTPPNATLKRTVWSTPQGSGADKRCCFRCKYWQALNPYALEPSVNSSHQEVTDGHCFELRIWAAYGVVQPLPSYYVCSYFVNKEKESG